MESTLQIILSVITTVLAGIISLLFHKLKKSSDERELAEQKRLEEIKVREQAVSEALRALCRDRILQGYVYYRKQNSISPADLETMTKLYNAYRALGGNGTVTAIYEKIKYLQIEEGV